MAASLEERVQRIEDLAEITKLTSSYAHFVNRGWNDVKVDPAGLATVFTEDITWAAPAFKMSASGRDAVIAMLANPEGSPDIALHSFTNPILEVTGDTATGNWLIWVAQKVGDENNELFQSEDLVYQRVDGQWRIKSIDLHFGTMLTGTK